MAPDVGGGFGTKIFHYAEEAIVTWAAGKLGRPVKWTADRSEAFISDAQGRDHVTHAELALDKDGKFLGLKRFRPSPISGPISRPSRRRCRHISTATLLAGNYTTPAIYAEVKGVFTNTVPVDAYRGAGRPEACYVVERLVDKAAREMKIDPAELRRRNFVPKNAFPYQTPVALAYDSGDYFTTLEMAMKAADYAGFEPSAARSRQNAASCAASASHLYRGLRRRALGDRRARSALAPGFMKSAEVRVHPTGSIIRLHRLAQPRPGA